MITSRRKSVWAIVATLAAFLVAFRVSQDGELSKAQVALALGLALGLPLAAIVLAVLDALEVGRSRAKHLGSGLTARPASYTLPILAMVLAASFIVPVGRGFISDATGGSAKTHPAVSASASVTPSWTSFTSPAGDFSVLFPGIPTERTETLERPGGPMPVYVAAVTLSPTESYAVGSGKDTTEHVGESAGSMLDRLEADFLTRSNGRLLSRADVYAGTVAGRELEVERPEMRVRARLFVTHQTIYQVLVFHSPSQKSTDDQSRFLDSFTIRASE